MKIGNWVRLAIGGKWHLVESIIDGDPVTRCGRRLRNETVTSEHIVLTRMIGQPQNCRYCDRG